MNTREKNEFLGGGGWHVTLLNAASFRLNRRIRRMVLKLFPQNLEIGNPGGRRRKRVVGNESIEASKPFTHVT